MSATLPQRGRAGVAPGAAAAVKHLNLTCLVGPNRIPILRPDIPAAKLGLLAIESGGGSWQVESQAAELHCDRHLQLPAARHRLDGRHPRCVARGGRRRWRESLATLFRGAVQVRSECNDSGAE
jgi:hypothetical protein